MLDRLWQRGRCANVAFEPKIGPVDELDVDLRNQRLFAGSREKGRRTRVMVECRQHCHTYSIHTGLVAVCDPRTGRVNRDIVYAVRDEQEIAVSCLKLNNHRVLVGHTTGNVSYIANVKDGGSLSERLLFEDQHTAPVSCFKTITARDGSDDMLCSGDRAGQVRIWDFRSRTCLVVLDGGMHSNECGGSYQHACYQHVVTLSAPIHLKTLVRAL